MGAAENRAAIERLFAEFYALDKHELAEELFAPSLVMHDATAGDQTIGPEQVRQGHQQQKVATPNLQMSLLQMVAEGDRVAYHWWIAGTLAATNMPFGVQGMTIARFGPDGKIAELWRVFDQLSMMNQTGQLQQLAAAQMGQAAVAAQQGNVLAQGAIGKKKKWGFTVTSGGSSGDSYDPGDD